MKQKIIIFSALCIFSINLSFAVEHNRNDQIKSDKSKIENQISLSENGSQKLITPEKNKKDAGKMMFKKSKSKFFKKFINKRKLEPQRILVLMIIGFLLLIPGMVLAALGVALIPAIILAVLGGTLFIVGLLVGK